MMVSYYKNTVGGNIIHHPVIDVPVNNSYCRTVRMTVLVVVVVACLPAFFLPFSPLTGIDSTDFALCIDRNQKPEFATTRFAFMASIIVL